MVVIIGVISTALLLLYCADLKKHRFKTKEIVMIGLIAAISFILSLIQFIRYPQGGGISLFSMMPVMLLALIYGRTAALTAGVIFGMLTMFKEPYIIHPVQFLLDYIFSSMALGLAGIFGVDNKSKQVLGTIFSVMLSVFASFLSGVVFFGQFAPVGMNVMLYSFLYNFTTAGVEGILCIILLAVLPIERFRKICRA